MSKDTSLSDEQRKQLLKLVADSQESIKPNTGGVPKILDKLTGTSRQVAAAVGNAIFNTLLSRRQRAAISRAGRRGGLVQITLPSGRRVIYAVAPGGRVLGAIPLAAYRLPLPVNFVNLRRFPPRVVFGPLGIPIIGGVPFINLGGIFPNIFSRTPGTRFVNFLGRRFPLLTGTRGLTFFNGPNGNRIIVQRGTAPATPPAINLTSRLWLENITVPSGTPRKRRAYLLIASGTGSGQFSDMAGARGFTWECDLAAACRRRRRTNRHVHVFVQRAQPVSTRRNESAFVHDRICRRKNTPTRTKRQVCLLVWLWRNAGAARPSCCLHSISLAVRKSQPTS